MPLFSDNIVIVGRHLAIVSPFPPEITGIGQYGYYVSRALAGSGSFERVTLLTARLDGGAGIDLLDGLRVERIWRRGSLNAGILISRRLRQLSPDVVWYNLGASMFGASPFANLLGLLSLGSARRMGLASVATLHELLERSDLRGLSAPGGPVARLGARIFTRAASQADVLCVTLKLNLDWLVSHRPWLRVAYIPIGFYDAPTQEMDWTVRKATSATPPELLVFTTFAPFKGLELMTEVYLSLREEYPGLLLTIAGARHNRFPGYVDELRSQIKGNPGIRLVVDVAEEELPEIFRRASLVVLPYFATTGASSVLSRAVALGRPVVASSLPELVAQSREMGLRVAFFPPADGPALRRQIVALLDDSGARAGLVRHNLEVAARVGMHATLGAYLEAFEAAVQSHHRSDSMTSSRPTVPTP